MAASLVDEGAAIATSTTISVTIPAAAASGDVAIIVWAASDVGTLTTPSGWTQLHTGTNGNLQYRSMVRVLDSGDPGDPVNLVSTSSNKMWAAIAVFRGVDGITPIAQSGTPVSVNASSTTRTNPAITLATAALVLCAVVSRGNTTLSSWTAPSPWTRIVQAFNSGSGETSGALAINTFAAGAIGGDNWTSNVADLRGTTLLYAFTDAGGGGGNVVQVWNGTAWVPLSTWNATAWADTQVGI